MDRIYNQKYIKLSILKERTGYMKINLQKINIDDSMKKKIAIVLPIVIMLLSGTAVGVYNTIVVNSKELEINLKTKISEEDVENDPDFRENDDYKLGHIKNPYIIESEEDMITLQDYSKENTCEGMYFEIAEMFAII